MIAHALFQPEKTELQIGFLPLIDCGVLVAAQERGLFEKYGLQVQLKRETSWASIRDRVAFGELDAAHMLAPMPLAASLGIDGLGIPMETAFSMGLNGSAITLSSSLMTELEAISPESFQESPLKATAIKALLTQQPDRKLTFAHVFPFSQHHYLLRAWLQDADIDPDHDVELTVIPPSLMVNQLASGDIDGYCAGSPWNQVAVLQGCGQIAITAYEIWNNGPDKVLGVTQQWAKTYPQTHQALIAALLEAAKWLDNDLSHRMKLAQWLSLPHYLDLPVEQLKQPLTGHFAYAKNEPCRWQPDYHCFHRYAANVPWHSQGQYFLQQIKTSGQLELNLPSHKNIIDTVYRLDTYRSVAQQISHTYPLADNKPEGKHQSSWVLRTASQPIAMGSSNISLMPLNTPDA
jgi:nitrate/nitrite transport system substrate-binding protein